MGKRWACKPTAERLLAKAEAGVAALRKAGATPHLAVVLIGQNPASKVYVAHKIKTCEMLGIRSTFKSLPDTHDTGSLLGVIDDLNRNRDIHGILVQLPLPAQIHAGTIFAAIDPDKDVDGFHPVNVGRLSLGEAGLFPCTPMGIMELLDDSGHDLSGMHAVVIGRSNIVGKPMAQMLLSGHCTVSILHSRTRAPETICRQADLVVAAVGRTGMVDGGWLKPGALVVDVGMNEITTAEEARRLLPEGSKKRVAFERKGRVLYGDVNYASATRVADRATPVPGGVGLLTIAQLMLNCVTATGRLLEK